MNIYHYSENKGEYLGVSKAALDPIDSNPLIPALATSVPPPETQSNQAACWNGFSWEIVSDYRNVVYWTSASEKNKITQLGEEPPVNAVLTAPPENEDYYIIVNESWKLDNLKYIEYKTNLIQEQVQQKLNMFAQTRYYNDLLSACSYANSSNPTFAAEGKYCTQLRDDTWSAVESIFKEVKEGLRPVPLSFNDIKDELPIPQWPY